MGRRNSRISGKHEMSTSMVSKRTIVQDVSCLKYWKDADISLSIGLFDKEFLDMCAMVQLYTI